jgi:peptidoglycan/LPS O-acetylase OafA/YrhL
MVTVVRWVLLAVIGLLLVNLVVLGIGTSDTGPVEKLVLVAVGVLLVVAAWKVHHLGPDRSRRA